MSRPTDSPFPARSHRKWSIRSWSEGLAWYAEVLLDGVILGGSDRGYSRTEVERVAEKRCDLYETEYRNEDQRKSTRETTLQFREYAPLEWAITRLELLKDLKDLT